MLISFFYFKGNTGHLELEDEDVTTDDDEEDLVSVSRKAQILMEPEIGQATMWLGTEDGTIHVYNCTDNIRIKKNKDKFCHSAPVLSIL